MGKSRGNTRLFNGFHISEINTPEAIAMKYIFEKLGSNLRPNKIEEYDDHYLVLIDLSYLVVGKNDKSLHIVQKIENLFSFKIDKKKRRVFDCPSINEIETLIQKRKPKLDVCPFCNQSLGDDFNE